MSTPRHRLIRRTNVGLSRGSDGDEPCCRHGRHGCVARLPACLIGDRLRGAVGEVRCCAELCGIAGLGGCGRASDRNARNRRLCRRGRRAPATPAGTQHNCEDYRNRQTFERLSHDSPDAPRAHTVCQWTRSRRNGAIDTWTARLHWHDRRMFQLRLGQPNLTWIDAVQSPSRFCVATTVERWPESNQLYGAIQQHFGDRSC